MIKLSEISREESARYMGVRGVPDENVTRLLDKYEPIVRENLRPAYVYRQGNVERTENELKICGVSLLGNDIRRHLEGCERAIIIGATVSSEADKLIRQTSVTDMAAALAVDALCSAAIEQVCNAAGGGDLHGGGRCLQDVAIQPRIWRSSHFSPEGTAFCP